MKQTKAPWTKEVTDILFVYNSRASNHHRSMKWIEAVAKELHIKPRRIDWLKRASVFDHDVMAQYSRPDRIILIAIAGGDGTVSHVVNRLMKILPDAEGRGKNPDETAKILLLPLWGGNANDMACMLNGLDSAVSTARLLTHSEPVAAPLIRLRITRKAYLDKLRYACCYASFGATAYAARKLDQKGFAKQKFMQYFPPAVVARELMTVLKAIGDAPAFRTKTGETEAKVYEHTLVNGSRLAKLNRIPIQLTEPQFFHAVVTKKNPSIIIELLRIVTRRRSSVYSTKTRHSFILHDSTDAQIDGEVHRLDAGTKVSATIFWPPFQWISVNFAKRS